MKKTVLIAIVSIAVIGLGIGGYFIYNTITVKSLFEESFNQSTTGERIKECRQKIIDKAPNSKYGLYSKSWMERAYNNNPQRALDIAKQLVNEYSDWEYSYLARSNSYRVIAEQSKETEYYDKMLNDAKAASDINPNFSYAYSNMAKAFQMKRDYDKAIKYASKAISLDRYDDDAFFVRAYSKANNGDTKGAINDYTESLKISPNSGAYNNLGVIKMNDYDNYGAIEAFTQALKYNSEDDLPYYNRGRVRLRIGERVGAYEDLKKAASLGNRDAGYLLRSNGFNY